MMCFLVVKVSHNGSFSCPLISSELSLLAARRFLVDEVTSLRRASDWMCFSRALEAFSVYSRLA